MQISMVQTPQSESHLIYSAVGNQQQETKIKKKMDFSRLNLSLTSDKQKDSLYSDGSKKVSSENQSARSLY